VLYLLHGYSDDASGWSAVGRANLILDSLIDSGKAKPMLVVMPLGYGAPEIVQDTPEFGGVFSNAPLRKKNFDRFRQALIQEVIPQVEQLYRVQGDRGSRAIAGPPVGGAESLLRGLYRPAALAWVAAFSAVALRAGLETALPRVNAGLNPTIRLLWISWGTDDNQIELNRKVVAWMKSKDIRVTAVRTPGMHAWGVWRRNLFSFAPLLFRSERAER